MVCRARTPDFRNLEGYGSCQGLVGGSSECQAVEIWISKHSFVSFDCKFLQELVDYAYHVTEVTRSGHELMKMSEYEFFSTVTH